MQNEQKGDVIKAINEYFIRDGQIPDKLYSSICCFIRCHGIL
jgi:hypothetical protein